MHAGVIERFLAAGNAKKARRLLECFFPELRHVQQRLSRCKGAVLLAISDDILCKRRSDAGDIGQQRYACGVHIHADGIDAVLDHARERFSESLLRHVVLVLPDADGFRVDLDKLRERILQASCNGNRAAQGRIILREFLRTEFRGGVHRGARLGHDGIFDLPGIVF